jgi:hypothetical protein
MGVCLFLDFVSIIQDIIPEVIPSQKCHMNMGPIPKGYIATDISCCSFGAHTHV